MKYLVKGLTVMLILGFALTAMGCADDVFRYRNVYRYAVEMAPDLSFQRLVNDGNGALFQRANRSIRFFGNGQFRSAGVGLNPGNATAVAVGNRWRLVSENALDEEGWSGRIAIYQDPAAPAAAATVPAYFIDFTLIRHRFVIDTVEVGDGVGLTGPGAPAGGIPTAGNLPRGVADPFNWGRIPNWIDDATLIGN